MVGSLKVLTNEARNHVQVVLTLNAGEQRTTSQLFHKQRPKQNGIILQSRTSEFELVLRFLDGILARVRDATLFNLARWDGMISATTVLVEKSLSKHSQLL